MGQCCAKPDSAPQQPNRKQQRFEVDRSTLDTKHKEGPITEMAEAEIKLGKVLGQGFFTAVYLAESSGKQVAVKPVNLFGHGPVPWAKGTEKVPEEHPTGITGPEAVAAEFHWGKEVDALKAAARHAPQNVVELLDERPLSAIPPDGMKAEMEKVQAGQGAFIKMCQDAIASLPPNRSQLVAHLFQNAAAFAHLGPSSLQILGLAEHGNLTSVSKSFTAEQMARAVGVTPGGDPLKVRALFTAEMMAQLATGISACHKAGYLHMDVHLDNTLLDAKYNARLTDFGCTRLIADFPAQMRTEAERRKLAYRPIDFARWVAWDDESLAKAIERCWDPSQRDRMFPGIGYPATQIGRALLGFHARDTAATDGPKNPAIPAAGAPLPPQLQRAVDSLLQGLRKAGVAAGEDAMSCIDATTAAWEQPVRGAVLQDAMECYLAGVARRVADAVVALRAAATELRAELTGAPAPLSISKPIGQGFFSAVYLGEFCGRPVAVKPVNVFGHGPVPFAQGTEKVPDEHPTGITGRGAIAAEFAWGPELDMLRKGSAACPAHIVALIRDVPLSALPADAMKAETDKVQAGQAGFVKMCQGAIESHPPNKSALVQHMFFNAAAFAHLGPERLQVMELAAHGNLTAVSKQFDARGMAAVLGLGSKAAALDATALRGAFVAELMAQLAEGIRACHSIGIMHMDVHLDNTLLDGEYNARLTDFGCTRQLADFPGEARAEAERRSFAYRLEDFARWVAWDDESLAKAIERCWDPSQRDRMFPGIGYPATQMGRALLGFHARDTDAKEDPPVGAAPGTPLPGRLQSVVDGLWSGLVGAGVDPKADAMDSIDAATEAWKAPVDGAKLESALKGYFDGVVSRVAAAAAALRQAAGDSRAELEGRLQ